MGGGCGGGVGGGGGGGGGIPRSKSLVEVFHKHATLFKKALIARLPLVSCQRCLCMAIVSESSLTRRGFHGLLWFVEVTSGRGSEWGMRVGSEE